MFGIAPLLRGLLTLAEVGLVVGIVLLVLLLVLRMFGIDVNEVRTYQRQRKSYGAGLAKLHDKIAEAESDADLLYAAALLRDFQSQKPAPPQWAFWLRERATPEP